MRLAKRQNLYYNENYYSGSRNKNNKKAVVLYDNLEIPVNNILCIRDSRDIYGNKCPKSIITMLENNPYADNKPMATECEYLGSAEEWAKACDKAEENGSARINIDFFA